MSDREPETHALTALRPLPARPNLEFERKRAKKLVKTSDGSITLALAQLHIAREYGFSSWRKLLSYYRVWDRHFRAGPRFGWHSGGDGSGLVRQLLREFDDRRTQPDDLPDVFGTAAAFATFVPRFFGLSDQEIFQSTVTIEEAQYVVARMSRFSDWQAYQEHLSRSPRKTERTHAPRHGPRPGGPISLRSIADGANDRERLMQLIGDQPALLAPHDASLPYDAQHDHFTWQLILTALSVDPAGPSAARSWAESLGLVLQPHLDHALLGNPLIESSAELVGGLLALGANPHQQPASGFSVLEHGIALYRNGAAVDLLVPHVAVPQRFWVAAGLGDLRALLRYVNRRGVPSAAARADRLDMTVFDGVKFFFGRPDASDHDVLWDAFFIAGVNGRLNVLDALIARGFPVDYSPMWYNLLHIAVEQLNVPVVEFLLARGANPALKRYAGAPTARDFITGWREAARPDPRAEEIEGMLAGV